LAEVTCKWKKPLVADKSVFSVNSNVILYVPTGTKEVYEVIEPWCYFSNIVESVAAGVDDVASDDGYTVNVVGGAINVSGDAHVRIVSMSGVTVYNGQGECSVNVTPGIYVVTVDGKASKVAVK
jgi:hypothetical protein